MATLKKINIYRNWGIRPDGNTIIEGNIYYGVDKGEPYDLVQFSINEINGYYWNDTLCVPVGTEEDEINRIVNEYVATITEADIKEYQRFLDYGNKYGWD